MSAKFFVADDAFGDEATCGICFNLWEDPVEVKPCEHIFCRKCFAEWGGDCPVCRKEVVGTETPCLPILRMLMRVKGVCHSCTWRGTYKEYKEKHMMVSCCNFSGPEVITPCSSEDDVPAPAVEPTPSTAAAESMNDYYLETPASPAIIPIPVVTSHELSAADYGLEDEDFNKLRNLACSFAQTDINSSGQPHLPWRSVCRLLRYLNYPNHPDDVENLFETAKQHPSTGAISFHALCLWLSLNRRNPQQWYNINNALYSRTLHLAQLLDTNQTGLFTLDQCFLLGEEYFGRCIQPAEWQTITVMLREKDTCIRQSFTVKSGTARGRSGSSDSDIKLPFHDTLLAFKRYRANTQQQIRQMEAEKKREDLVSRIKQMILHYEPPAASQIDHMLRSFKGEEEDLLKTLTLQYGPEPPPGSGTKPEVLPIGRLRIWISTSTVVASEWGRQEGKFFFCRLLLRICDLQLC